jgi:serine/threonine protein kinase
MPAPSTTEEFLELVRKSGVVDEKRLASYVEKLRAGAGLPGEPSKAAGLMVRDGILTHFQADQVLQGKWRRFTIGKYKVLERLGSGGMGSVYLCEHKLMRRRVAVKVLPTAKADDPSSLERFYREARAVAALDHPNIVRAYDIDQDDKLHFLVMEYVDGSSLQEIIKKTGPMDVARAAHYTRQSAMGLQHAFESAALVHRDIKPGNILVDRQGVVKILDMGLARFFNDEEDILTKKYDENVLGTADYLAPEQALDSHGVDIRADIYSLGATFYFCLTGRTPFTEGTVAQKLIWHQTRQPKPIRQLRPEVPEGLVALIERMMAKDPAQRPQTPLEVADALEPWTQTPIGPPLEEEMPRLSPAALGLPGGSGEAPAMPQPAPASSGPPSSSKRKNWQVASASGGSKPSGSSPTQPAAPSPTAPAPPTPPAKPSVKPPPPAASRAAPPAPRRDAGKVPASPPSNNGPAPQRTAAVAAPPRTEPAAEEEHAPWEQLHSDTGELSAAAETTPRSGRKTPVSSSPRLGATGSGLPDRRRVWWVVGIVSAVLLGIVGAAALWALTRDKAPPAPTQREAPPASRTWKVGKDSKLKLVADAWRQAGPNDRIVVQGPTHEEDLFLDGRDERRKNITIEPEEGQTVVWKAKGKEPSHLLVLSNVDGLRIRGFTLDGLDRCRYGVVLLTGRCPGTALEAVNVRGFRTTGVLLMNCAGDEGRPVTLSRVSVQPQDGQTAEAALTFNIDTSTITPKANQYIRLRDGLLDGAYKAPVSVLGEAGTTTDVALENVKARPGGGKPEELVKLPQ